MNVNSGNSGNGERDGKGPSGLPVPGTLPTTSELRRRATSFFDREMGPAETIEFQARLAEDPRALRDFEATRRAIEHLKTGRPAPDLTGSILDEVERRRRLLGAHRHARRRRVSGVMTTVGAVALLAAVFFGVDSILPQLGGAPVAKQRGGAAGPLVSVPTAVDGESDGPNDSLALQLRPPVDASRDLRWDISGSPMLVGAPTDIGRGGLPLETTSWVPLGTSGVWPSLFPNASVTRPPISAMLIEPASPAKPAADDKASDKASDKATDKSESGPKPETKPEAKPETKAKSPR